MTATVGTMVGDNNNGDNNDDGESIVGCFRHAELGTQVNDRHDGAAQIHHAFDVFGHVGDGRDVGNAFDFLDTQNLDPKLFFF